MKRRSGLRVQKRRNRNVTRRYVDVKWGPGYLSRYSESLRAGQSGDWIPVGGEIFRTCTNRPWGPPSLVYDGYRVFPEGKAAGAWRWPPTPPNAKVKERVQLYLYSPSGPSWPFLGWTLPLPLPLPYTYMYIKCGYNLLNPPEWGVSCKAPIATNITVFQCIFADSCITHRDLSKLEKKA